MNPIFLKLGPFEIRYYGLMYAVSFLLALTLIKKDAKENGLDENLIENYGISTIVAGLIGGRLYYVIFNLKFYLANPLEIPAVWHGGMAIHGAILGGIIWSVIFTRKHRIKLWTLTDMAAPLFILGQGIGRIGNFMNGEVHGVPTFTPINIIFSIKPKFYEWFNMYNTLSLQKQAEFKELVPWGIVFPNSSPAGSEFPNLALHPAMLYEMILNLMAFVSLYFIFRKKNLKPGTITCLYLIEYSLIRTFVSFFRSEDLMFYGLRAPHLISIVLITDALITLIFIYRKKQQ